MSGISTALGSWQKGPARAGLAIVAAGSPPAATTVEQFITENAPGLWIPMGRPWQEVGWANTYASPMKSVDNFKAALIKRPAFSVNGPCTRQALAILATSFFQSSTYTGASPNGYYALAPWASPLPASCLWLALEAGIAQSATSAIQRAYGCVCNTLKITGPAVDQSGGFLQLSAGIIGAAADLLSAFSATPSADASGIDTSSIMTCTIELTHGGTVLTPKVRSFDIDLANGATLVHPHGSVLPIGVALGELAVSGTVSLILSDVDYAALVASYSGQLAVDLLKLAASGDTFVVSTPAILEDPEIQEDGNTYQATFRFRGVKNAYHALAMTVYAAQQPWA